MNEPEKVKKYEEFLNNVLKEDLRKELESRDKLFENIAAHLQLKQTVNCILEAKLTDGLRTRVDLGSNFYAQAHIPDPSSIFVNIGLNTLLEMSLCESVEHCDKKIKLLNEELTNSTQRSAKIKGKIRFVELALMEVQELKFTDSEDTKK